MLKFSFTESTFHWNTINFKIKAYYISVLDVLYVCVDV